MNEKLNDALDEIQDAYITDAAKLPRRRFPKWLGAVAAVLVVVLIWHTLSNPWVSAKAISLADYSEGSGDPLYKEVGAAMDTLSGFFSESMTQVLSGADGENMAYSPVNLYLGLAALAELTGGNSQILQALQVSDLETLRHMSTVLWNGTYEDGNNPCLLANSIWLNQNLSYNQAVMDRLAQHHYTSVYQGNLGTSRTNRDITNWLNKHTDGLLKDSSKGIDLDPQTVFALYSTIFYQAKWQNDFSASQNTTEVFHAPSGDVTCTFMNKEKTTGHYYWGTDFGAITLRLKDGSSMWLILPDADKTVEDVLSAGEYTQMFLGDIPWENSKDMFINLSLPKFDIRSSCDLKQDLQALGITDVFEPDGADFSSAIPNFNDPIWLASVNQATRVAIDEKGITAASYIEFPGAGSAAPPEDTIDFVLDRPFLFVVTNWKNVPLFAGVVNNP